MKSEMSLRACASRAVFAFVGAAVSVGTLFSPAVSEAAKDLRIPCLSGRMDTDGGDLGYECMFPDSSNFRASQISTLNLHLADSGSSGTVSAGSLEAKACISYYHAVGGACSGTASNSAYTRPGAPTLYLSTSVWSPGNTGHFKYVTGNYASNVVPSGLYAYIP